VLTAVIAIIAEGATLFCTLWIRYLAQYLVKPESDLREAAMLVGVYAVAMLIGSFFRNFSVYYGY
jgi:hypothetical protein